MRTRRIVSVLKRIVFGMTVAGTTLYATSSCSTILSYIEQLLTSSSSTST